MSVHAVCGSHVAASGLLSRPCASRVRPFATALHNRVDAQLRCHLPTAKQAGTLVVRRQLCVRASASGGVNTDVKGDTKDRMDKSLEVIKRSFASVRTGRANPAMLDRIEVDYYGTPTALKTIAGVTVPESSQLVIQPYDTSAIPAIERAIQQSDLGLTPNNDGKVIRLIIPPLTADRRKEMTKTVSKLGEEGKVAIRNVRRDAMKVVEKMEKDGVIGEDEKKDLEADVQKTTDAFIKQVDALIKGKQDELTKV